MIAKLFSIHLCTSAKHNGCFYALAPFVIGNPNNGCIDDIRVAQQSIFNLSWRDVFPATDDRVIGATFNK